MTRAEDNLRVGVDLSRMLYNGDPGGDRRGTATAARDYLSTDEDETTGSAVASLVGGQVGRRHEQSSDCLLHLVV